MIKVTVLYPNVAGKRFDYDYYQNVHIPLAIALLGPAVRSVTVERGLEPGTPWPSPAFFAIAGFECESVEAYTRALVPHMKRLQDDVANYTDVEAIIQVSEIVEVHVSPS
jgi:uncharacterized protein (TIGR02118 family)